MKRKTERRWWQLIILMVMTTSLGFAGGYAFGQTQHEDCDEIVVKPCPPCSKEDCVPFIVPVEPCKECPVDPDNEPTREITPERCLPCPEPEIEPAGYVVDLTAAYRFDNAVLVGGTWNWKYSERYRLFFGAEYDWDQFSVTHLDCNLLAREDWSYYNGNADCNPDPVITQEDTHLRALVGVTIGLGKKK